MKDTESGASEGNWKHPLGPSIHCRLDKANAALLVDFNPSRIFDPQGTKLCSASLVAATVKVVIEELMDLGGMVPVFAMSEDRQEYLDDWEPGWQAEVGLIRVDVARDFALPPEIFDASWYQDVKPKNARATVEWRNNGQIETISGQYGKKTGAPKFYNKHLQSIKAGTTKPAPAGTFRFEQVLRWKQLHQNHLHALDQLTEATVERALHKYWDKSRLGEPVVPQDGWLDYFLQSNAPVELQCCAIAHLMTRKAGKSLNLTKAQIKEVEDLSRSQGLKLRMDVSKQSPCHYRLDLPSGHLVEINNGQEQVRVPPGLGTADDEEIAA
jgi:hypothetical protein